MSSRLAPLLVLLVACSSDPLQYSAPVGIELKAKSSDVSTSVISEQKAITTESGNPYGAFVSAAMTKLGGKAPGSLAISDLSLTLGAQSTGVTALEEVTTGDVDVAFLVDTSNNTYDAGHVMDPTGVGPVAMDPTFDWSAVSAGDQTSMLQGSFKVVLRGASAASFSGKGAEASLQLTFTFAAFE